MFVIPAPKGPMHLSFFRLYSSQLPRGTYPNGPTRVYKHALCCLHKYYIRPFVSITQSKENTMSHSGSNHHHAYPINNAGAHFLNGDGMRAVDSDQAMNALMEQYLAQSSGSSTSHHGSTPSLSRRSTDPRTGQSFQHAAGSSTGPGHHHATQASSWVVSSSPQAYGSHPGSGHPGHSTQASAIALHSGDQPSFADLMREMGHEQSRALYVLFILYFLPNSSFPNFFARHNRPHGVLIYLANASL
ncbi:hypothetical protein M408DRAFT_184565 [Serendipita vermifera MAFF 305830]|uniref:Uncharacterized protein n=1 Tax=Serendipita vermifera MAFF 305830 TaxID=933852 RepID=A0A0C3B761_SERVB|nr:hypothetical protein M408DRAFT_184565 [Serendipita vermifera MAFF 305830]